MAKSPPALTTAKKFEYEDVAFRKVQKENEATSIWWLTSEYRKRLLTKSGGFGKSFAAYPHLIRERKVNVWENHRKTKRCVSLSPIRMPFTASKSPSG